MPVNDTDSHIRGTAGYAENADFLAEQYESITFEDIYRPLIGLLPDGGKALDIGAGTGRDAAALGARGFEVHAVEPTAELRAHGRRLHPDPAITWSDDALPDLAKTHGSGVHFDLILMTAVWMHLDQAERDRALPRVSELLAPGGRLFMSVRKGPVPSGRRMFEVPIDELVADAQRLGLDLLQRHDTGDMFNRSDVTWTKLAFEKRNRV